MLQESYDAFTRPAVISAGQEARAIIEQAVMSVSGGGRMVLTSIGELDRSRLAAAAAEIRVLITDLARLTGCSPLECLPPGEAGWVQLRGWALAHEYLAGTGPEPADACCEACLQMMTTALASVCVGLMMAGGNVPAGSPAAPRPEGSGQDEGAVLPGPGEDQRQVPDRGPGPAPSGAHPYPAYQPPPPPYPF